MIRVLAPFALVFSERVWQHVQVLLTTIVKVPRIPRSGNSVSGKIPLLGDRVNKIAAAAKPWNSRRTSENGSIRDRLPIVVVSCRSGIVKE
jgi:hypothetical protein